MLRIILSLALIGAASFAPSARADQSRPHAVLELFTSQGCSSCPAADAFVGELEGRYDVLALTMPVKLWDFLGWADTLATDELTKRQIAYSVARGDRDVFTPQMMANGETSLLGSDKAGVAEYLRRHPDPLPLPIDLALVGDVLTVKVGEAPLKAEKVTLWLLVTDGEMKVPIGDGENRGRRLSYYNVVRTMRPIGMWKGQPLAFDLPLADIEKGTGSSCIVMAQVDTFKGPCKIVGAARIDRLFPARTVQVGN